MDKPATIKDVAELARVHAATASRALNPQTRDKVSPRTAARIVEAARTLGYSPNSAARSLRTRTSSVVGVVIPDLRNPVFPPIVRGVEDALREAGYLALLGNTDGDAERERDLLTTMRGQQLAGFILATSRRDTLPPLGPDVSVVLVNRRTEAGDIASVVPDSGAGVRAVVNLLVERGHRRIAHLAGPQDTSTGVERHRAFLDGLAAHGLSPVGVVVSAAFTEQAGYEAAQELLAGSAAVTAIVAGNDMIALGCYRALEERGLRCPEDVSVTGFNDMPFLDKQRPALTTVRIPHYDIGYEAARLLLERIANPGAPAKRVVLPVQLITRDSVTSPASPA
ncbi:LacI family DNA-binding transcriptional regulator [Kutzneria buriramensis]|uniref:LacI family transcriptional regulator n=1 Tax=Kutzneria buriramensis TaxID=1045776 RepID=A0A3E0HQN8_9PSEU|nr:LacI family DNA-binding transcriptional regulator [Kutzneria buriramensis]REH48556.1 LacI family transcriptional regulator [Kutzneria buriramensis]